MSWLDELTELERRANERLAELEPQVAGIKPLIAEYNEVTALLERLGREREAAPAEARTSTVAAKARPRKRAARKRAASKPAASASKPAASASKPAASRSGSTRPARNAARPGERERQLLELVSARPGITVSEIARELSVDPTGLYGIVRRLEGKGRLNKDGAGLRLQEPAADVVAPG